MTKNGSKSLFLLINRYSPGCAGVPNGHGGPRGGAGAQPGGLGAQPGGLGAQPGGLGAQPPAKEPSADGGRDVGGAGA